MIYIYLKTHNITGLKYLGKTIKNPNEYAGSGIYWKRHLKKYGDDVTTTILFQSEDITEIKEYGLHISTKLNIVESNEFANLMPENGIGGITSTTWKKGSIAHNKGKKCPNISKAKKEYWIKWKEANPNYKNNWKKYIPKGKENWIRVDNTSELNRTILKCPYCNKEGNVGNMKRWHFDKCKNKNDDIKHQ
jgi:hypothetical protein